MRKSGAGLPLANLSAIRLEQMLELAQRVLVGRDQRGFVVVDQMLVAQQRLVVLAEALAPIQRDVLGQTQCLHHALSQHQTGVEGLTHDFHAQVQ